jgi:fluoride ion exporter CrcB/FEX
VLDFSFSVGLVLLMGSAGNVARLWINYGLSVGDITCSSGPFSTDMPVNIIGSFVYGFVANVRTTWLKR